MKSLLRSLGLCALAACGGSGTSSSPDSSVVGVGSDPGTGTGTLVVDGTAAARPAINNSGSAANFTTDFSVHVTLAGAEVTTGTVAMQSTGGAVSLIYDAATMRWHGAQAGYFEAYTLDVTSGADSVNGVRVDGPDIHTFTAPMAGATVDSAMPLAVTWAHVATADAATIRTRMLNVVSISDTGTYSLAAGSLKSKPDQTETEQLDLVRSDRITPAGAAVGSSFQVTVSNSLDLVVKPTQ
jgi:hypothetical protein